MMVLPQLTHQPLTYAQHLAGSQPDYENYQKWLSGTEPKSTNVTTMLTAKGLNNKRLVLVKKTLQYFFLPQVLHNLIKLGKLTDLQSNMTSIKENKIFLAGLRHHPLHMASPEQQQHHHHHHHHYHQDNHPEPHPMLHEALPFLQPLLPRSMRHQPHVSFKMESSTIGEPHSADYSSDLLPHLPIGPSLSAATLQHFTAFLISGGRSLGAFLKD